MRKINKPQNSSQKFGILMAPKIHKRFSRKAYYYSVDALIAVVIIFTILFVVKPINKSKPVEMSIQEDTIEVLSSLKISEIDNSYVKQLIVEKKTSENLTILEQIAEFYAKGMPEAETLTQNILSSLKPRENIGVWFNNELVASYNSSPIEEAENIWASRQIVSGVEKPELGEELKGYSARAFLSRANQVKYFYFGGYIGDGNISARIGYSGTISSAIMEIAINKNFALYVNGVKQGDYTKTTSLYSPQLYSIPLINFHSGENIAELKGNNLYIAGGYIKITYNDSSSQENKKFFPGISGLINTYDSFYIPSTLNSLEIFLNYSSPYKIFLNIGNKTVYEGFGDIHTTLTNAQLSSQLNYQELSQKTIPVRLGLYEIKELSKRGNADVVLITDLSGSMDSRMDSEDTGITRNCDDPLLYNSDTKRLSLAKCLDKMVTDIILNVSGNRLALSAFYGDTKEPYKGRVYYESLTNNSAYLKSKIDAYSPQGGTCICCSENNAYNILQTGSNETRQKFVIVMSDGIPTHTCQAASGCEGTRDGTPNKEGLWLGWGAGCYGGLDDCGVNDCECASQNSNWSSCRLRNNLNTTVYSVGFGPVSDCWMANKTLRNIANCGQGKYYASQDPNTLKEIYEEIAEEILQLVFIEQVSNISTDFNLTTLYPSSYIYFDYQKTIPYGLVITSETPEFGNEISEGNFSIPEDSIPLEAIAVSYSGSKWTDKVSILNGTWQNIFNLSHYGADYLELGDPYFIYIPKEKIEKGENKVTITTGTSPTNYSGGSSSNKVIYTILKNISGYSEIKANASGCIWNIEFDDLTESEIKVPFNYSLTERCYYTSSNIFYNMNDAVDAAVFNLLRNLDFDLDNRVDNKFSEQDLQITESEVAGIPYPYDTEIQVRVWR